MHTQVKEFITDASERVVQRATKHETQKKFYSGKKKSHTVKNAIYTNPHSRRITSTTKTTLGKTHDK